MRESQYQMFEGGEVLGNGSSLSMDEATIVPPSAGLNQPSLFRKAGVNAGMPSWAWIRTKVQRSKEKDAADWLMQSWEDPRQLEL